MGRRTSSEGGGRCLCCILPSNVCSCQCLSLSCAVWIRVEVLGLFPLNDGVDDHTMRQVLTVASCCTDRIHTAMKEQTAENGRMWSASAEHTPVKRRGAVAFPLPDDAFASSYNSLVLG